MSALETPEALAAQIHPKGEALPSGASGYRIALYAIRARDEQIRAALLAEPPLRELPELGDLTEEQERENDAGRRALERFATRLGAP